MLLVPTALAAAVSLVLTGGMAGFFYAYSVSAMPGLDAVDPRCAIVSMQGINVAVRNPVFFTTFFGTPVVVFMTAALLMLSRHRWAALSFVAAGMVYLGGAFLPTAVVNVPMNEALAALAIPDEASEVARLWSEYSARWTAWNTTRTIFSTASLLLVGLGIFAWGRATR